MKKLINLIALVMLVSTNVLTPFSYANAEISGENPENAVEKVGETSSLLENQEENEGGLEEKLPLIGDNENENEPELEKYKDSPSVNIVMQHDNIENKNFEELDESLVQPQNLDTKEVDLNNPIQISKNGEIMGTYTGLSEAINEAESGDVIHLIDDISVSEASILSGKILKINGNNHVITRIADITTITINEDSSLILEDIIITDNATKFTPNRQDSLLKAINTISLCLGGINETIDENGNITKSECATENLDTTKTNPQILSKGEIYGNNLTISNSLSNKGAAAIITTKGGIEMINSNFIHNGSYASTTDAGRGGAIRIGPNTATDIVDESPITKILFSGCYFENNYGGRNGGAMSINYAPETVTIDNCTFSGNTAYSNGGVIHIPNIQGNLSWKLPPIPNSSVMPVGTLYINGSEFYNNRCGNDGAAIENDDLHLEINQSKFEHNYGAEPWHNSVGVVSCQAGGTYPLIGRGNIWREYRINNSQFKDTNTNVLGDHNMMGGFIVDSCSFENQSFVLLSYNGVGEIKNSFIKNSNPFGACGIKGGYIWDFEIDSYSDYFTRILYFDKSSFLFKLDNNRYTNDCTTNEYFQVRTRTYSTGETNLSINSEIDTRVFVHKGGYDSKNIEGTDEIYYGATIDDRKFAYLKKSKFYNFDEFNEELKNFSYGNSGYQLASGKAMLFYLDSGYTELWSGFIQTTTNLYGKESDIHNITYEGIDGVNFEGITHTNKFVTLNHTQYLTEFTPYTLNIPSRNGYKFEGRFLDSGHSIPIMRIESGSTGDITLFAKRKKLGYSGGGGGGGGNNVKPDTPKEDEKPVETPEQTPQKESDTENVIQSETKGSEESSNTPVDSSTSSLNNGKTYTQEFQQAYEFARQNGITTMPTIQKAQMNSKLTRIQMAKMLSQYAINVLGKAPDTTKKVKFKDVTSKIDKQYDNGVTLAYQLGIMGQNMKNNRFRPNDEVTRAEFATTLSRLIYSTSDGEYKSTPKYYIHHMEKLVKERIITNDNPKMKELRGYVMIMLMRSAQ